MYIDHPEERQPIPHTTELDNQIVISANGLLIVLLGLYPTALISLCAGAFTI
jgi:NADH-quinone oxidoreductase subunit N